MRIWFWRHVHDMAERRWWHWTYYNKLQKRYGMPDEGPTVGLALTSQERMLFSIR